MGGGDLNSKKSWHPNNLKNQERVKKAEEAAALEKKHLTEMQKKYSAERELAHFNSLSKKRLGSEGEVISKSDDRLQWMYEKGDKTVQAEDYLLGKSVDGSFEGSSRSEAKAITTTVGRRVAGVLGEVVPGDSQVDLVRKLREDPLALVRERERAARAALLNNPLQRRKLTELLRKDQEKEKTKKSNKTQKKEKNLDTLLASKISALGEEVDLAGLLASDDSSSSSEGEAKKKKKKKKCKKKSKKHKIQTSEGSDSSDESNAKKKNKKSKKKIDKSKESKSGNDSPVGNKYNRELVSQKRSDHDKKRELSKHSKERSRSDCYSRRERSRSPVRRKSIDRSMKEGQETEYKRSKVSSRDKRDNDNYHKKQNYEPRDRNEHRERKKPRLSEAQIQERLKEMARAGEEHEQSRGRRVERQRAEFQEESAVRLPRVAKAPALPESLESRIHSNRHYIQRDKRHMNEHFAKR